MIRGKSLSDTMSQYLLSRIEKSPRISILTETEVQSFNGRSRLEQVAWVNRRDGSQTSKRIAGMFVMIGAEPNTSWLKGVVDLDKKGFVRTGGLESFDQTPYATNVPTLPPETPIYKQAYEAPDVYRCFETIHRRTGLREYS